MHEEVTLTHVATQSTVKVDYLALQVPDDASLTLLGERFAVLDSTGQELEAALSKPKPSQPHWWLLVRVSKGAPVPTRLSLVEGKTDYPEPGVIVPVRVVENPNPAKSAVLQSDFADAWRGDLLPGEPFASFAEARVKLVLGRRTPVATKPARAGRSAPLRRDFGIEVPEPSVPTDTDLREWMDFFSGGSAIESALALRRGLGVSSAKFKETVELSKIAGVTRVPRDYAGLKVAGASPFRAFPLAAYVPNDAVVVEFASFRDALELPKRLEERLGLLSQVAQRAAGRDNWQKRLIAPLGLEIGQLAKIFGDQVVGATALAVTDPWLKEGTDATLLLEVRNEAALDAALGLQLAGTVGAHGPSANSTSERMGQQVTSYRSADGAIQRHEVKLKGVRVLSNSLAALDRVLSVAAGKHGALASSPDYRYARSLRPFDAKQEQAFAFFGDGFVERITGPRARILESRRVRARQELRLVDYAALLYGRMEGTFPASTEEMLKSGWLKPGDLTHFDGSAISWDRSQGASSHWGTARRLLPIAELELTRVDPREELAYRGFRESYESSWNQRLDPMALTFTRSERSEAIEFSLRVLPLNPNSNFRRELDQLLHFAKDTTLSLGGSNEGLGVTVATSALSSLRTKGEMLLLGLSESGRDRPGLAFIGDWLRIGIEDDPSLWNEALREREVPTIPTKESARESGHLERLLTDLPAWVEVQVTSKSFTNLTLLTLRKTLTSDGAGPLWKASEPHAGVAITSVTVHSDAGDTWTPTLHYAIVKDVLVASLSRTALTHRIDAILSGKVPTVTTREHSPAQAAVDLTPSPGGWWSRLARGYIDRSAVDAHRHTCDALRVLAHAHVSELGLGKSELEQRFFGVELTSPYGAGASFDQGECKHPLFGSSLSPTVFSVDAASELHRAVEAVGSMRYQFGIEPRGEERELWLSGSLRPAGGHLGK